MTTAMDGMVTVTEEGAFVGKTAVPVHHVLHVWRTGETGLVEEVIRDFPVLDLREAMAGIAFALGHPEIVERMRQDEVRALEEAKAWARPMPL